MTRAKNLIAVGVPVVTEKDTGVVIGHHGGVQIDVEGVEVVRENEVENVMAETDEVEAKNENVIAIKGEREVGTETVVIDQEEIGNTF